MTLMLIPFTLLLLAAAIAESAESAAIDRDQAVDDRVAREVISRGRTQSPKPIKVINGDE